MIKGLLIMTLLLIMMMPIFAQRENVIQASPLKESNLPHSFSDKVDYTGFLILGDSLEALRRTRMIDEETFIQYSQNKQTIILDTRSKKAFEDIHVAGAVHLNFSDFTEDKLAEKIPNKTSRILIYCNNNFESSRASLANKRQPLALNIPTFINLYGYGYENVFELNGYLKEEETKIQLVKRSDASR